MTARARYEPAWRGRWRPPTPHLERFCSIWPRMEQTEKRQLSGFSPEFRASGALEANRKPPRMCGRGRAGVVYYNTPFLHFILQEGGEVRQLIEIAGRFSHFEMELRFPSGAVSGDFG